MRTPSALAHRRTTTAVLVYLIILVSFQVFVVTVAVEAFTTGNRSLGWAAAAISVVLAGASLATVRFLRR
ncbi:MAG: hypothetical protein U0V73_05840 [Acidimicrobiia bacterium]